MVNVTLRLGRAFTALGLLLAFLAPIHLDAAHAATVTATGTNPSICNQTVSNATYVTAVRLAGGDCVITFTSGTVTWTPPTNVQSIKLLLVGGGGGGGGSYDTAGAGGGGGGQFLLVNSRRVISKGEYVISVGQGGQAGYHTARANTFEAVGLIGSNSTFSTNGTTLHTAYAGRGGSSSRVQAAPATSRAGGSAATLSSGGIGGGAGGGGYSGGGGGGSSGNGGNGSTSSPGTAVAGGAGTVSDITGISVTYGAGGAGGVQNGSTSFAGSDGGANTGNGGGGASVAGGTYANGGNGGSGIVVIRYSTAVPVFSNLSIAGNVKTAIYRSANTLSATVDVPSFITFYVGKSRIAGCISVPTTGTSPNNTATCTWKPSTKGAQVITADAIPSSAGLTGASSTSVVIGVSARVANR